MTEQPLIDDFPLRLSRRFRRQQAFAAGYAPLSSRVCGLLADWLEVGADRDPVAAWLLAAGRGRASFDVPLLLLAGLHREVLAGEPAVVELARYYPSAGGALDPAGAGFAAALRAALLALRPQLAAFLQQASVQTNEVARGLCWLLPACFPGWPGMHLVELGASAGLNLAGRPLLADLGRGEGAPIVVVAAGDGPQYCPHPLPQVLTRTGCDLAPLDLSVARDARTLAAFVWADQTDRLVLLRRGMDSFHRAHRHGARVQLYRADLPAGLTGFLNEHATFPGDAPILVSNTYLTTYLQDRGAGLRPQLAAWAAGQPRPVLWLQWETLWQGPQPPEFGWLGWTADLWQQGEHRHWQLAWVQPHGARVQWLPGLADWTAFWRDHSR
jgi:hypothetical protein